MATPIQNNSEALQRILQTVMDLPEESIGVTVQRKDGTFTTGTSGTATVNVGFQPDVVYIKGESHTDDDGAYDYSQAVVFSEDDRTGLNTVMWNSDGLTDVRWERTSTGFYVTVYIYDYTWDNALARSNRFTYVAIKYT